MNIRKHVFTKKTGWQCLGGLLVGSILGAVVWAQSPAYTLRFTDALALQNPASRDGQEFRLQAPETAGPEAPVRSANDWLLDNQWKQVWPLKIFGKGTPLFFAGPPTQRYLRVATANNYFIWSHPLDIDPQTMPYVTLTWGVERFPEQAALDVYGRNDRAIAVLLSFGPKVASGGLLPDVPRGLALFWGESEVIGKNYTCTPARQGSTEKRLQCNYPHVQYIAVRRGGAGTVHTDSINIRELFQQHFADYMREQQRVPPIVGLSFEAGSDFTNSTSSARLYSIHFAARSSTTAVSPGAR